MCGIAGFSLDPDSSVDRTLAVQAGLITPNLEGIGRNDDDPAIVAAAAGYPSSPRSGDLVTGLDEAASTGALVFGLDGYEDFRLRWLFRQRQNHIDRTTGTAVRDAWFEGLVD